MKIRRWLKSFIFRDRISIRSVRHIDVEPVAACNLKCEFCQVPGWNRASETRPMDIGLYKKIVDQFPQLRHVKLQGMGEPFLNKKLTEMIRYATKRNIATRVTTNGMLLNPELNAEILEAGLTSLVFSFDGATKQTYEQVRIGSDYDRVIHNIESICQLKKQKKAKTSIGLVCLSSNKQVFLEIPSLVELVARLGVERVHVKGRLKKWQCLERKGNFRFESDYLNTNPRYAEIIAKANALAGKLGIKFTSGHKVGAVYSSSNPCPWPWTSLYISTEGKVVPCCAIGIPDTWSMGDLKTDRIEDIWNNGAYRELRRCIRQNRIPGICRSCYG